MVNPTAENIKWAEHSIQIRVIGLSVGVFLIFKK
jgi:hypothetical protein